LTQTPPAQFASVVQALRRQAPDRQSVLLGQSAEVEHDFGSQRWRLEQGLAGSTQPSATVHWGRQVLVVVEHTPSAQSESNLQSAH
jgi:hypothetical protein